MANQQTTRADEALLLGGLIVLGAVLFFPSLSVRDLAASHEARAAQDAQAMLDAGSWGLPRLYDLTPDLQKPPLFYWLVAAIGWLRGGVDALAVRLPAALAALVTVLLVAGFFLRRGRPIAGFLAGAVLATMTHFTWLAQVGRIDMPLTAATTAALVAFRGGMRITGYLALAAAVLFKGPIGLVLPVTVLTALAILERRWRPATHLPWGVPLLLAVALPWFVWVNAHTNGEFLRVFVWHHHVERALGGSEKLAEYPWWYYAPRLAVDLLPWTPMVLIAVVGLVRRSRADWDADALFGVVWLLIMVGVLSCARFKRADYLLPAYPGAALLLGCWAERWLLSASAVVRRRLTAGFAVVLVLVVSGWTGYRGWIVPRQEAAREYPRFAATIRQLAPAPRVVLFFRAEAHALAFRLGKPLNTFLEWENLDVWAGRPGTHYIVMPPDCARDWPRHVHSGDLVEVARTHGQPGERPLVLMRTVPHP